MAEGGELALITKARQALVEAQSLPEIRKVMEVAAVTAEAQRRNAKLMSGIKGAEEVVEAANEAANDAAAVRIEAQARAGEMLRQMAERGERDTPGGDRKSSNQPERKKLEDLGVAPNDSTRWQQVAEVPPEVREEYVEVTKATGGEISTAGLMTHAVQQGAIKSEVQIKAEEVIQRLLNDGPVGSKEFQTALQTEGVTKYGRDLATKALGVVSEKSGASSVWKYGEVEEVPRKGSGWECPTCGGYGWVPGKPKIRNPRGVQRERETEQDRARRARKSNGG